jgi:thioredoxin 1
MPELHLSDQSFDTEVVKSQIPVLIDFWAPWCGPCRMLAPIIEELAKEYDGKVKVAKVNTDENPAVAAKYKISAIPTLLVFRGGQVIDQLVGVHPKPEIKTLLEKVLS